MDYKFLETKWYVIPSLTLHDVLDAGLTLSTIHQIEFFDSEELMLARLEELN